MRPDAILVACLVVLLGPVSDRAGAQDAFVTLVHSHFSVTDGQGHPVTNLGPRDVTVYDNDMAQEIAELGVPADAPLSVAILIDRSQSIATRFQLLRFAASAFASSVLTRPDDRGLLVAFDTKVYLLQGWTSDSHALTSRLDALTAAGGTSLFDALYKTCRDEFDPAASRQHAVVLVTDGEDTTSVASLEQALRMAALTRTAVYVVGVPAEPGSLNARDLQGRAVLEQLTDLTGGRLFHPESPSAVGAIFERVGEELRNTYTVAFSLDRAPDGAFHRLRVEPRDKSLVVHAPRGYYARTPDLP